MSKSTDEDGWRSFIQLCAGASEDDLEGFFHLFLSSQEKTAIATRYEIFRELNRGEKSQREMAKDLKVSIAKITRGSNFVKTLNKKHRSLLEKIS